MNYDDWVFGVVNRDLSELGINAIYDSMHVYISF